MPKARYEDDDEELMDYKKRGMRFQKETTETTFYKFPDGETIFRILKTPEDEARKSPEVWIEYYMHWGVGPKNRACRCGLRPPLDKGECWLCDKLEAEADSEAAEEMQKKRTVSMQLAVYDKELEAMVGPKLLSQSVGKTGKAIARRLVKVASNERDYVDHKTGYNFTLIRTGTGLGTNYEGPTREDESSVVPKEIVRRLKPFADVLPQYDPEIQKRAYYGKDEEDEEAEREDVEKRPKRKIRLEDEEENGQPRSKKVRSDEDEEDEIPKKKKKPVEDEDDLEYGQDEEDEIPKKKKKIAEVEEDDEEEPKPKKRKVVVEEEEEELEVDEDEEERPKKKIRR